MNRSAITVVQRGARLTGLPLIDRQSLMTIPDEDWVQHQRRVNVLDQVASASIFPALAVFGTLLYIANILGLPSIMTWVIVAAVIIAAVTALVYVDRLSCLTMAEGDRRKKI